jgi:hypothetical protein
MSLGMFLMTSPVGELVNWDDLKKSIATGDILLCQTVGLFGAIEQLATSAPYTHVAVFIRGKNGDLMILESSRTDRDSGYRDMVTGKTDGPKVIDAEFYIRDYIGNDRGVLTYRPLRMMWSNEPIKITVERENRLNDLFDVILKKDIPYERNLLDLANALLHVYGMDHTDPTSMFCSETVSTVLKILDVPLLNLPDKTTPCDYSEGIDNIIDQDENKKKGMNAVKFGHEVTITNGIGPNNETNNSDAKVKTTTDFPFSKIPIGPRYKTPRSGKGLTYNPKGSSDKRHDVSRDVRRDERFDKLVEILRTTSYILPPLVEEEKRKDPLYVRVDPYTERSRDINEFRRILRVFPSKPWIDEEDGPVDVNQIIRTDINTTTNEVRATETLLSLAVENDLDFEHMIQNYPKSSYVDILLSYKKVRERMLYSDERYQEYIDDAKKKPNGLKELEKRFGILDINQRIIRSAAGREAVEWDALIDAIEFNYKRSMYSLLNDPSIDDTLAYKHVERRAGYNPDDDRWPEYKCILDTKRDENRLERTSYALKHGLIKEENLPIWADIGAF